jgi:phosphopentomutase
MLIITADHGCDPSFPGTDHTREYVPLLVYASGSGVGRGLGTRESFADIASTLAEIFSLGGLERGSSFLAELT